MEEVKLFGSGKYRWTENTDYIDRPYPAKMTGRKEELDWIRRQLEYVTFAQRYKLRYDLKRGDIVELDWGLNVNAEFSNRHYGVVLVDSCVYNPLVTVCPLKTNKTGAHPQSDVDLGYIECLQSTHRTLAVINQIRSVDKLRIYTKNCIGEADVGLRENEEGGKAIHRLENEKVELILQAYMNYLLIALN